MPNASSHERPSPCSSKKWSPAPKSNLYLGIILASTKLPCGNELEQQCYLEGNEARHEKEDDE